MKNVDIEQEIEFLLKLQSRARRGYLLNTYKWASKIPGARVRARRYRYFDRRLRKAIELLDELAKSRKVVEESTSTTWIENNTGRDGKPLKKPTYTCPYCSKVARKKTQYCPECGAHIGVTKLPNFIT